MAMQTAEWTDLPVPGPADGASLGDSPSGSGIPAGGPVGPAGEILGSEAPGPVSGRSGAYRWAAPAEQADRFSGFDNARIIAEAKGSAGDIEWYFRAREGIIGPYPSRNEARDMLIRFVARCRKRTAAGKG